MASSMVAGQEFFTSGKVFLKRLLLFGPCHLTAKINTLLGEKKQLTEKQSPWSY